MLSPLTKEKVNRGRGCEVTAQLVAVACIGWWPGCEARGPWEPQWPGQQPATSLSGGGSPGGSWNVLSSARTLKADAAVSSLKDVFLFLDGFTLELEKREKKNSALRSSLSPHFLSPPLFPGLDHSAPLPVTLSCVPAPRPSLASLFDFGFLSERQQGRLVDVPWELSQAGCRAVRGAR